MDGFASGVIPLKANSAEVHSAEVLPSAFLAGQTTSNALHNRYSVPSREQMELRPGVSITVQYGKNGVACEIRIHPTAQTLLQEEPNRLMNPDIVSEVIAEIAPEGERGAKVSAMYSTMGCNINSRQEYAFVNITRFSHECLPLQTFRESPAFLIFKWPECAEVRGAAQPQMKE